MPSKIKIEIRAELRDPQGKLIKRYPWKKANSLLKQFIQILMVQMSTVAQNTTDTGGVERSLTISSQNFNSAGAAALTTNGVVVGSGTTPVSMTDTKLQTQVTTNVAHSAHSLAVENPDASTWRVYIARVFTNNTGATLQIREVGLYCFGAGSTWNFAIDHTLYSVDVPNGVGVTITYRITISL